MQTNGLVARAAGEYGPVTAATLCRDGQQLVWAAGRVISVWDIATRTLVRRFGAGPEGYPTDTISVEPRSGRVAAAGYGGAGIYDLRDGRELGNIRPGGVEVVAFSPAGDRVALLWGSGKLSVRPTAFDGEPQVPVGSSWSLTGRNVTAFAWARDGTTLFAGTQDGYVLSANALTGGVTKARRASEVDVSALAVGPDSRSLVVAGIDGRLLAWRDGPDAAARDLGVHEGGVTALSFLPSGSCIVSAGRDTTLLVWPLSLTR